MIVAGWSAYSRQLDFARFRAIADEVGAYLFVDMAHFAGLVATGLHPSPMEHAHVVTTTTHKTLGGPRGGVILTNDEAIAKKINSAVFPGMQGGPLEHVIAAKAVSFKVAAGPEFADRQRRTVAGAATLAARLSQPDVQAAGISVLTGGTDVHLVLVDLRDSELDGKAAEDRLHSIGVTVNRNAVPFDPRPPMVTSGLRIGTPALATRGFDDAAFAEVADIVAQALLPDFDDRARGGAARAGSSPSPRRTRSTPGSADRRPRFRAGSPRNLGLLRLVLLVWRRSVTHLVHQMDARAEKSLARNPAARRRRRRARQLDNDLGKNIGVIPRAYVTCGFAVVMIPVGLL